MFIVDSSCGIFWSRDYLHADSQASTSLSKLQKERKTVASKSTLPDGRNKLAITMQSGHK